MECGYIKIKIKIKIKRSNSTSPDRWWGEKYDLKEFFILALAQLNDLQEIFPIIRLDFLVVSVI